MQIPVQKLKEMIVNEGLITPEAFDGIAQEAQRLNQKVEDILVSRGIISSDYFYTLLSHHVGIELANLSATQIDESVLALLSLELARQKGVVAFKREADGVIDVAMEDPSDLKTIEFLERHLKVRVKPFLAKSGDLEKGFAIYSRELAQDFKRTIEENIKKGLEVKGDKVEDVAGALPIVAIVNNFLSYAISMHASDIHIEMLESSVLVRFRIDGILHEVTRVPKEVELPIVARIKLLAGLKIDEHYKPQDGRLRFVAGDEMTDVRVSIMPTLYGEKIVMRLLPAGQKPLALEEIGMLEDMVEKVEAALKKSFGMVVVCGPTGSGKTTTLYSILNMLNKPEVNMVTVEDPIEYHIQYVNQTQINTQAGVTFASALRAFLRQDPNIILVGEIRDEETAEISVHAALTGHTLLSSLHTNDAATAIPRLIDMKVPPFLIAAVLNLIIAQRLVRKICVSCIESFTPSADVLEVLQRTHEEMGGDGKVVPKTLYHGRGCPVCNFTGHRGRMGIFEVLEIDNEVRTAISDPEFSLDALMKMARQKGMITMLEDGVRKAELGMTTMEEVLRVIRE
ncbi:MAG: Type 4 fimbrial assembly protein PilB [Candidatus Wolfebacteria bacterium GW2011_GWB2_46_69]|uniref:Type II secretion system protein E, type IV pilus assembly protein PilB n=2 Tax=Candidatus Wolfeibacteriota TaxID=1752735 RepID=A0A0G4AT55_9BACT|nr:MAG: type II secretion system protein E, type IV pilus assembly protein PilB [Candidatus Wolfebacteria bacterium GW2011_GWB1_47_1]KKU41440.1 MAG: Type 4 fimbrial assembly protein PilB [Candidatus Wolfebacteria bacterium GW2011_GWB2_46_69]KKU58854.1 MAG: Type 4 fimbrial assembly protein PilB [Candidatus Wolfebacteria bacterium GW2011_GWE2_47_12]KKU65405.1 MAG: Type 4 fimbrial assembly protein PilB [Candidatus Wolfebacteria bacterium GW2011_GWD2_47_17]